MEAIVLASRVFLGSVLLMAGLTKLANTGLFASDLQQYRLIPAQAAVVIARVLPWLEIVLAGTLLSGVGPRISGAGAFLLLAAFIGAALTALWRKLPIECSCFGLLFRMPIGFKTVTRDAFLLCLAAVVLVWGSSVPSVA